MTFSESSRAVLRLGEGPSAIGSAVCSDTNRRVGAGLSELGVVILVFSSDVAHCDENHCVALMRTSEDPGVDGVTDLD